MTVLGRRLDAPLLAVLVLLVGLGIAPRAAHAQFEALDSVDLPKVEVTAGAAERSGLHYWIDYVSPGRGSLIRHGDATMRRLAHLWNLGFAWEGDLFSVRVTNSVFDVGQFTTPGGTAYHVTASPFTNPGVTVSIRPIRYLRLDVEADFLWAFDMTEGPDEFTYTSLFGGLFAVWEPSRRYAGGLPLFDLGLGVRGGMAWTDPDMDEVAIPVVPEPGAEVEDAGIQTITKELEGARVMTGARLRLILPIGKVGGLFLALGYYVDPVGDYDGADIFWNADWDWTLGLRWWL
jgi:hypothetical protein